jgi:hypothetical protein
VEGEEDLWQIHGIVQDVARDAHAILGSDMALDRSERMMRQILVSATGAGPVKWDDVDSLTAAFDRQKIVSARFGDHLHLDRRC